jgi:hypothetical protein
MARNAPTAPQIPTVPDWQPLAADVLSYGYAVVVLLVFLTRDISMGWIGATAIAGLFLVLRAGAREVHRNHRIARRAAERAGLA